MVRAFYASDHAHHAPNEQRAEVLSEWEKRRAPEGQALGECGYGWAMNRAARVTIEGFGPGDEAELVWGQPEPTLSTTLMSNFSLRRGRTTSSG